MKDFINKLKDRVLDNFKKNKFILLGFIVLWIAFIVVVINEYDATLGMESVGNEVYERYVTEVNNETVIEEIVPIEDEAECVSVLFATYARQNRGNIVIKITGNESGHIYADNSYPVDAVQDNAYLTIKLNERLSLSKDQKIKVTITSDSLVDSALGVYHSMRKAFEDSTFTINNELKEDTDLSMRYLLNNETMRGFSNGVIIYAITALSLLALLLLLIDPKKEVYFAVMVLVLGLIMMLIINPSSPPDELSHYEIALQLSNKMMGQEDYHTIDHEYIRYGSMYGHYNIAAGYKRFIKEINEPAKITGIIEPLARDVDEVYTPQYVPNALGLTLGRLLGLNMITTFYLGRLTGLLFYVGCIYIAIKNIPTFKFLLGMIASLPMLVQIGMSITYDTFIIGICFMIMAFFLKWYFSEDEIDIKEYIFVAIICNLLAPAKIVYGMFSFLFLFIPSRKYGGLRNKIIMVLVMCLSILYHLWSIMHKPIELFFKLLFSAYMEKNLISVETLDKTKMFIQDNVVSLIGSETVRPHYFQYSFHYMFTNPLEVLDIFYRTVRYRIKSWFYGSIGRTLSGETLVLPLRCVHALVAIVVASAFIKPDIELPILIRVVFLGLCILIGLFTMIGMFVAWTDSDQEVVEDFGGIIIEGIQGRYFSPILIYFFSIFPNKKIGLPKQSEKFITLAYLMLFFFIVIYVMSYTFVN